MKISLTGFLLVCCFTSLIGLLTLNLIKKEVFLVSSLSVNKITTDQTKATEQTTCSFLLNWQNQPISSQQAVAQIRSITGLKGEFIFDFNQISLQLKNDQQIMIHHFKNNCQWLFRPVLIEINQTTLLRYLIYQIFNF